MPGRAKVQWAQKDPLRRRLDRAMPSNTGEAACAGSGGSQRPAGRRYPGARAGAPWYVLVRRAGTRPRSEPATASSSTPASEPAPARRSSARPGFDCGFRRPQIAGGGWRTWGDRPRRSEGGSPSSITADLKHAAKRRLGPVPPETARWSRHRDTGGITRRGPCRTRSLAGFPKVITQAAPRSSLLKALRSSPERT
jgi:hypothetical protein